MRRASFPPKPHHMNKIERRKLRFEILMMALLFAIIAVVFFVTAINIHNRVSEERAAFRVSRTASLFHSFINRTLILVEKASNSNALRSWFADEENAEKREIAYYEMTDYSRVLPDPHLYFGITDSLNEFSFLPGTKLDGFAPYKKLDPDEPWDAWYFECAASDKAYVLNFDRDDDTNKWKLWLNHKVQSDSGLSGVFCAGFEITSLLQELFFDYDDGREHGFLIDEEGAILMASDLAEYYSSETKTYIQDTSGDPEFNALIADTIAGGNSSSPEMAVIKSSVTPFRYNAVMKIPDTDWSIVVLFDSDYLTGFAGVVNFLPVPLALIITIIAYAIVSNMHTARLVFRPLDSLTRSVDESDLDALSIYGSERTDEIGELSRAIRESRERLNVMYKELTKRDKKLSEQAYWYKSLLDGIPLPISVTDADMNLTFVNTVVLDTYGKNRDDMIGQPCCVLHTPICGTPDCAIVRARQGLKKTYFQHEGVSSHIDSEIIRDMEGNTLGYMEILHDVTEVENSARREADAANEAKTAFLANMSHEMRTPLNAIIGLSELSLGSETLDEEVASNLIKIHNAGATLVSTVNDILDISKIESGKLELVPVEYELGSLINDVVTQNILRLEEKPLELVLDIEKDLPARLYGDELRIKEILNNLVSNALKYTREGTVELGMRSVREGDAVWLRVWVKDSGIGIRKEDLEKLFGDYVQLDKKANREIQGTGLGLAITKRLVELMDGEVTVQSEYGKGSVFSARIKQDYVNGETIGAGMAEDLKKIRYIERKRRQNLRLGYLTMPYARVLVVDDSTTNLDVAKGMLKPYGMNVDCVKSGEEAVAAIRGGNVRYNAVFMDHMMPGMDGIEAVKIIRGEIGTEYAKTIPIIALTANAIMGSEEKFLSAGFQAFVSKPIEQSRLDAVLREWVRDEEQERQLTAKGIEINGKLVRDTRRGKERRRRTERRSGIDRRVFGSNIAGLDLAQGMARFENNREAYRKVLRSFAVGTRHLFPRIREPDGNTLKNYAIIVHGIKSSCQSIGALPLGDRAEALEQAAKQGNADFVAANNGAFIEALEQLVGGIESALRGRKRKTPKPKAESPDRKVLEKLLDAARQYNMDDAEAAVEELEKWDYKTEVDLVLWLRENVDLMNFVEVAEKLSAISAGWKS